MLQQQQLQKLFVCYFIPVLRFDDLEDDQDGVTFSYLDWYVFILD